MRNNKNDLQKLSIRWVRVSIDKIADVNLGKTLKRTDYISSGNLKIVKYRDITESEISWDVSDKGFVPNSPEIIKDLRELKKKDILISASAHTSQFIGKKVVYIHELPKQFTKAFFVGELLCIRIQNEISPKIVYFYFLSQDGYTAIQNKVHGVHLIASRARKILIPLPPLSEQHRIVAKIEGLFTKLDAGVEALKKVKVQIERYRQTVLKVAMEGRLTEEWRKTHKDELEPASLLLERITKERKMIAKGKYKELLPLDTENLPELPGRWAWTTVGQIGEVVTGTTPSKTKQEYYGSDHPFFKPTDLNAGYYVRHSRDGLSKEGLKHARLLPEKCILVTCIGATIGKTGFIRVAGASNQQINALTPEFKFLLPEFIYFLFISPQINKSIIDNSSSTTLPILNKSRFERLFIPLPPLSEQHKIVEEVERRLSVADETEKAVEQSFKQAERLRQSILEKAFEGKLVPQDPTDEPASVLLERIKNEKTKQ